MVDSTRFFGGNKLASEDRSVAQYLNRSSHSIVMIPIHTNNDLPDYIRHTMAQAVGASGRRIIDHMLPNMEVDVRFQYANRHTSIHSLAYKPEFEKHREHLLLESATKIKRLYQAPLESRVIPEPAGALPFNHHQEQSSDGVTHQLPLDIQYKVLYESITRVPSDLRVYKEIIDAHPQHADSLWSFVNDYTEWPVLFEPEPSLMAVELAEPMIAMYAAYAIEMNNILGQGEFPIPESHDVIGQSLADRLYVGIPQGYQGDVVATEAWANQLGIENIYRWKMID